MIFHLTFKERFFLPIKVSSLNDFSMSTWTRTTIYYSRTQLPRKIRAGKEEAWDTSVTKTELSCLINLLRCWLIQSLIYLWSGPRSSNLFFRQWLSGKIDSLLIQLYIYSTIFYLMSAIFQTFFQESSDTMMDTMVPSNK